MAADVNNDNVQYDFISHPARSHIIYITCSMQILPFLRRSFSGRRKILPQVAQVRKTLGLSREATASLYSGASIYIRTRGLVSTTLSPVYPTGQTTSGGERLERLTRERDGERLPLLAAVARREREKGWRRSRARAHARGGSRSTERGLFH